MSFKIRAIQQPTKFCSIGSGSAKLYLGLFDFFSCRAGAQSAGSHGSAGSGQRVQAGGNFKEISENMLKRIIRGHSAICRTTERDIFYCFIDEDEFSDLSFFMDFLNHM
jgi:hypothetical protein